MRNAMSWINRTWGDDKETQFKGFILVVLSSFFLSCVILLLLLRLIGIGDGLSIFPLLYLLPLALFCLLFAIRSKFLIFFIGFRVFFIIWCFFKVDFSFSDRCKFIIFKFAFHRNPKLIHWVSY